MKRLILALAAFAMSVPALAFTTPPPLDPTKSIVDGANILSDAQEAQLEAQTRAIYDKTHHHIVVLTMPSLDGQDGAEYAWQAFRHYKIGNRTRNDGVLLLVSMSNPRRLQIATGYGLEGVLTDGRSSEITRDMRPLMKAGDFGGAIAQGVTQIGNEITNETVSPQQLATSTGPSATDVAESADTTLGILVFCLIAIIAATVWMFCFNFPEKRRREKQRIKDVDDMIKRRSDMEREQREKDERNWKAEQERQRQAYPSAYRPNHTNSTYVPPVRHQPTNPKPKSAISEEDRAKAAAIVAADRERERKRQAERDAEDRRRREREDEERRQRDSWSSSSSSYDSGSSWSSGSSSYDSGSSSYDSGGSSGGGGGGSDW